MYGFSTGGPTDELHHFAKSSGIGMGYISGSATLLYDTRIKFFIPYSGRLSEVREKFWKSAYLVKA